jgi:hypothetical protein
MAGWPTSTLGGTTKPFTWSVTSTVARPRGGTTTLSWENVTVAWPASDCSSGLTA